MRGLWLRWSWRDLRRRWLLVTTIALVIGLGSGAYASLLSTGEWRRQSNDASFELLGTHDVRLRLAEGDLVAEGTLATLVRRIPHASSVEAIRERLVVPTQVSTGTVLASGELVGTAITGHGGGVDGVSRAAGRALATADDGTASVVLEWKFALAGHLPETGELTLSGGARARYVGLGQSPEYFLVSRGEGALPFLSMSSYAAVFGSLHSVQALTGRADRVNDVVLRVDDAGAVGVVREELRQALTELGPQVSGDVTVKEDLNSFRVLYDDIPADDKLWRAIAVLILLGAASAALNLTTRVVEAQRREIGIGMALGVPARALVVRPLLFGAQVSLIGVVLGVAVGAALGVPLRNLFEEVLPLPVWRTPFQTGIFVQAAALGFLFPFASVIWPVARAVRVQPVEAIRVGHLTARTGSGVRTVRRFRLPGRSYHQIPVRNLLRTPRRSLLTALGIAAAVTTLVTTVGFLDTFHAMLDDAEEAALGRAPDRITASLHTFRPENGPTITAISALPQVGEVASGLMIPAKATGRSPAGSVDLVVETLGPNAPWTPFLSAGSLRGGIVLAEKAAEDLDVAVGDTIVLSHPKATGGVPRPTLSKLRVVGLHPSPLRVLAYTDADGAEIFGMPNTANVITITPRPGVTPDEVRKALLAVPEVESAETGRTTIGGLRTAMDEFVGMLRIAAAVTLLLALLIAFNTTSIGMDERSREHATMLAFGVPIRTVLAMTTVETALLGVLGTMAGIGGGYAVLTWLTTSTIPSVMPEVGVTATLNGGTVLAALLSGVVTVAVAPLFTLRRLRLADIPSTLRVVE